MGQRVVLHVGCPKTGTTGIQHALFENSADLASRGFSYPTYRVDEHFLAAVDLLGLDWGWGVDEHAENAWEVLAERVRANVMDAIISHEILVLADEKQIAHAVGSFGDAEVSVVVTARDLRRQIPAEYQEFLKYRHSTTYQQFLDCMRDPRDDGEGAELAAAAWRHQDVVSIAERWSAVVGPSNVTIVTVPPKGAPREELFRRFGEAVGLGMTLPPSSDSGTENRSLGVAEVELLRRFNEGASVSVNDADYADFARVRLVASAAAGADAVASTPLDLPPEEYDWVRQRSQAWVRDLAAADYRVIGDLNDLIPAPPRTNFANPEAVDEAELLDAALRALAGSATDFGTVQLELAQSRHGRWSAAKTRWKRSVVLRAERHAVGHRVLQAWRQRRRPAA